MVYETKAAIVSSRIRLGEMAEKKVRSQLDEALKKEFQRAADVIKEAKALIITAGAGMGVDSGLPDFRGPEGFWRAYPPLKGKGIQLADMSNPKWFEEDPAFAWGFFGHRYNLYSGADPHEGFQILRRWAEKMEHGYAVYTSNVDGHFQRAGFDPDKVVECHGSINFMQMADPDVSDEIWPVPDGTYYDVDDSCLRLRGALPTGPPSKNTLLARPNILMFGDYLWVADRTSEQAKHFETFCSSLHKTDGSYIPFVVIEIGSGTYVPTVRYKSECLVKDRDEGRLIRINPLESMVPDLRHVPLATTGLNALKEIDALMGK